MKAIRVRKGGRGGVLFTVHWLSDEEETRCGRAIDDLNIVDDLDLEKLPELEACGLCRRLVDGWKPPPRPADEEFRYFSEPAPGRLRTTGPLSHGARSRHGRRLR